MYYMYIMPYSMYIIETLCLVHYQNHPHCLACLPGFCMPPYCRVIWHLQHLHPISVKALIRCTGMGRGVPERAEVYRNGPRCTGMGRGWPEWPEVYRNGPRLAGMCWGWPEWAEVGRNGPRLAGMGRGCPEWVQGAVETWSAHVGIFDLVSASSWANVHRHNMYSDIE
jgi:hypothetical protein